MTKKPVRIAIDAMGGDHAPHEIIKGAILGARLYKVGVCLVGKPDVIELELQQYQEKIRRHNLSVEVVPATEVIAMGDAPGIAIRKKKDSSIVVTAKCVGDGKADAMVAAGSTGAAMASAIFNIGRIEGIDRPAIGVVLPSLASPCLLIDAGANADCLPEMLVQFGRMGTVFMKHVYHIDNPRVGLLNIGEEAGKGNVFVNSAFKMLEHDQAINFIGNIEGRDMYLGGAEVAVCDGFTGNVALKSSEGVATMILKLLKQEMKSTLSAMAGALLLRRALKRARKKVDHEEFGGALLMGIKGTCVIAHGGSSANAIKHAIRVAKDAVEANVIEKITTKLTEGSPVACL
ncbi:MAG: phosphate acyltransferase PlsX [Vampirovibrio sp.]|nr:phosphate acyltransferase PlsX [Vampirovibrio sp.]